MISDATNKSRKITKRTCAIPADADAMPPKPNSAATSATRKKTIE